MLSVQPTGDWIVCQKCLAVSRPGSHFRSIIAGSWTELWSVLHPTVCLVSPRWGVWLWVGYMVAFLNRLRLLVANLFAKLNRLRLPVANLFAKLNRLRLPVANLFEQVNGL